MKVLTKCVGPCRQTIKIEVPVESVNAEREELLAYYTENAKISGFRKGHAPKALIEKKYAKEMAKDLKEWVFSKFYFESIEKKDLKVIEVLDVNDPEIVEGKPVKFEVTVDVLPKFKLPKYRGIPIQSKTINVTDEQVDELVDDMIRRQMTPEEVEGRPAHEGDSVQVSYESTIDGQPLEENIPEAHGMGHGTDDWIVCDDETFFPGMGLALIGCSIGDKKDVLVTFPKGFIVEELEGITANFKVEVTGMREVKHPEMTEEILKKLHVESEEEFREAMRDHLELMEKRCERKRQQDQICEFLLKKTKLDVSETDLQKRTVDIACEMVHERMLQGMSSKRIQTQKEELLEEAKQKTFNQVKLGYIIGAIAKAERFKADERSISNEIVHMAIRNGADMADCYKEFEKEEYFGRFSSKIYFEMTMKFLLENAKVK